jgi:C4-type Zn-finger protein
MKRAAMTINTSCPLCRETIGDRAMKIEPVMAGRVAIYDYACPSCGTFLFIDADAALSDDAIMERIDRHWQEIVHSNRDRRE